MFYRFCFYVELLVWVTGAMLRIAPSLSAILSSFYPEVPLAFCFIFALYIFSSESYHLIDNPEMTAIVNLFPLIIFLFRYWLVGLLVANWLFLHVLI